MLFAVDRGDGADIRKITCVRDCPEVLIARGSFSWKRAAFLKRNGHSAMGADPTNLVVLLRFKILAYCGSVIAEGNNISVLIKREHDRVLLHEESLLLDLLT